MERNHIFHTSAHAKCILAGEHTVIKGCPAIVLPVHRKTLSFDYLPVNEPIHIDYLSSHLPYEQTFLLFFWKTLEEALKTVKKHNDSICGRITISNSIPMGAGIGFSSALCVVLARWFAWQHWIKEEKIFSFAKELENLFHGKSSGVDIAGAISDQIVHFEPKGSTYQILAQWRPKLYLSYSGQAKQTGHAVGLVTSFRKYHAKLGKLIDDEMKLSVMQMETALQDNEAHGFKLLTLAINHANHCFSEWGLITPELKSHMETLYALGAVAAKPTGAGEGGYVLSLWNESPPKDVGVEWIPLFDNE